MHERALSVALGLALVFGMAGVGSARPKDPPKHSCKCTCIAQDGNGDIIEGGTTSFVTTGTSCSIGTKYGCYVGDIKGSYKKCTGKDVTNQPGGSSVQPTPNPPSATGVKAPVAPAGGAATKH